MAFYLPKSKVLFSSLPGTGNNWWRRAVHVCHILCDDNPYQIWSRLPDRNKRHPLFAFHRPDLVRVIISVVRHPIAYYMSTWKKQCTYTVMGVRGSPDMKKIELYKKERGWHPEHAPARLFDPDFNVWVARMLEEEPLWHTRLVEAFVGPEGGEFCDFIGRTETLAEDFYKVMERLGYTKSLNRRFKGIKEMGVVFKTPIDDPEWAPSLKAKVLETEKRVIQRFYSDNLDKRWFLGLKRKR